jgi:Fe-S-cluster-containing hydrogenase component 2
VDYCYVHALTDVNNELVFDFDLCIGCGLCASHCPEFAIQMVLRVNPRKIFETAKQLDGQIQREAIVGKIKTLISG